MNTLAPGRVKTLMVDLETLLDSCLMSELPCTSSVLLSGRISKAVVGPGLSRLS